MLEQMRQNSKNLIIWVLFGIIIAVFIISFGPQAGRDSQGCGTADQAAMNVADRSVSVHSWRFAVNGLGFGSGGGAGAQADQRRGLALDYLLERELLAQAAEERGLRVSDDLVNQAIAAGDLFVMGHRFDGSKIYFRDGAFDYDLLERYASSVGLPNVATLVSEQRREQLADLMRSTLLASARASEEEARSAFIRENTKVTAQYVMFDAARYQAAMRLGDADLASYASRHADEITRAWDSQKAEVSIDKPRVQIRHILVVKKPAAPSEPPAAAPVDEARATIDAARTRIAGGADFAEVAHAVSGEAESKVLGGRIGWRPADSLGYGKEVVEATRALAVGALSEVIESADGYHLIKVEARSDKALTLDDKKLDLAAELAPAHFARLLARRDAEAALARVKTTPLEDMFEPEQTSGQGLPPGLDPADLGLPPDAFKPQPAPPPAAPGGEQGWVVHESETRFAQAGNPPAAAPPLRPSPPSQIALPAEPAADEPLPRVEVTKPLLGSIGPVARQGDFLAGVGRSKELIDDMFERLEVGKVADRLYEVESPRGFVLVRLVARSDADLSAFDVDKVELQASLAQRKSMETLLAWTAARCEAIAKTGEVRVNRDVLAGDSDRPMIYQPCKNIGVMSVLQQIETRQPR